MSLARFFQRAHYRSDATDFIGELRRGHPGLDVRQRQGRSLLWDKHVDRAQQAEFRAGRVPQAGYVYYEYADTLKRQRRDATTSPR